MTYEKQRKYVEKNVYNWVNELVQDDSELCDIMFDFIDYFTTLEASLYDSEEQDDKILLDKLLNDELDRDSIVELCNELDDFIYSEPLEFYSVSDIMYYDLLELDEPVTEYKGLKIWGRCIRGQAIKLDAVIYDIVEGK